MKLSQLSLSVALVLGSQTVALADTTEQRLARMEAMMAEMQKKLNAQEATIKKQQATIAEQKASMEGMPKRMKKLEENIEEKRATESVSDAWYRNIEVGALIEVEAGYTSPFEGDSESDVVLATFELGISSQVTDWVEAGGTLLYEEDETDLEVDTGYITLANADVSPLFLTAGQIYVPFGAFETHMVSDPLTLEIGETRESTL